MHRRMGDAMDGHRLFRKDQRGNQGGELIEHLSLTSGLVRSQFTAYRKRSEDRLTHLTPWYASATDHLSAQGKQRKLSLETWRKPHDERREESCTH